MIQLTSICSGCEHRQKECNGACACLLDGLDIIDHANTLTCPANRFNAFMSLADANIAITQAVQARQPLRLSPSHLWRSLHQRALEPVTDIEAEKRFVFTLADSIDGPCECRRHWLSYFAARPPTFDTPEVYFAWTVEAHNAVNQRLGKPLLTVEQARQQHT